MNRAIGVIFFVLIVHFSACSLIDPEEEVPSYIRIDSIILNDEFATHNISDVWINIDGNSVGVFEVPVVFPVVAEKGDELLIRPGIKSNGMTENRIAYPFYTSITLNPDFISGEEIHLTPEFEFVEYSDIVWKEDFEIGVHRIDESSASDTNMLPNSSNAIYGNFCGAVILDPGQDIYEGAYEDTLSLPNAGTPVFLELDYKCNHTMVVGIYAIELTSVKQQPVLYVTPVEEWNKIYIELTSTLANFQNAVVFSVYFGVARVEIDTQIEVYLDNINVIMFNGA